MQNTSNWQTFFDGHAPVYNDNCFTKNTAAEVEFIQNELGGENSVEAFYLESFSLVYFLFEEFDRYKFIQLLRSIREEKDFDKVFFKTYWSLRDKKGLEEKWKEFYL